MFHLHDFFLLISYYLNTFSDHMHTKYHILTFCIPVDGVSSTASPPTTLLPTIPPRETTLLCQSNVDCTPLQVCFKEKCVSPCLVPGACAPNAQCKPQGRKVTCSCPTGYVGDPGKFCRKGWHML